MDEDEGFLKNDLHRFGIGDEVRAQIAAIKLHAFDDVDLGLATLALFDRDDAFLADSLKGLGHDLSDGRIVIARDGRNRGNPTGNLFNRASGSGDLFDDSANASLETANHRVGFDACGDLLQTGLKARLGEHGRGGRSITGIITGLASRLADEPSANVFDLVLEFDLLGDADAVLGDRWASPTFVDDGTAAAGTERALDCC